MKVHKIKYTEQGLNRHLRIDYTDVFCGSISNTPQTIQSVSEAVLNYSPPWLQFLYKLRHLLVKPFAVKKHTEDLKYNKQIIWQIGQKVAFFTIVELSENKIVLKAIDNHLSALLCIEMHPQIEDLQLSITTAVAFHNRFGRCYFTVIKPFHKLIIKAMINHLNK